MIKKLLFALIAMVTITPNLLMAMRNNYSWMRNPTPAATATAARQCFICYNDNNHIRLACGHESCTNCLTIKLESALRDQKTTLLRCDTCRAAIVQADIQQYTQDQDMLNRLTAIIQEENRPRSNEEWIQENTRPCTRCNASIHRIDGCDHMTCKNPGCGNQFCYNCLGPYHTSYCHRPKAPFGSAPFYSIYSVSGRLLLTVAVSATIIGLMQASNYYNVPKNPKLFGALKEPGKSRWSKATEKTKDQIVAPFTWTRDKLQNPFYTEKAKGVVALTAGVIGAAELAYWIASNNSLILRICRV